MRKVIALFAVVLLLSGCDYSKPIEIKGLDSKAFKNDRGGCSGERKKQMQLIVENKDLFLGISENVLFKTIGRYDYQVLDKKNEKVFVYYLEPGGHCENMQNVSDAQSLVLYLNAVKLVKEVVIQKGGHEPR